MAMSFIGKPISLISHSDVRYRGILAGIDPANSTIQLQNVFSMGTENRRPPAEFIPPADQPYQYIIFRASEVKDLSVEPVDPPPQRNLHDDPAIIGASGPPMAANGYGAFPAGAQYPAAPVPQQPAQAARQQPVSANLGSRPLPQATAPAPQAPAAPPPSGNGEPRTASRSSSSANRRQNSQSVHTAAASMETVERALGDLRVSNQSQNQNQGNANGGRGARRGGGGRAQDREIKVPPTDFDFASSNARFDKSALSATSKTDGSAGKDDDEKTNPSDDEKEPDAQKDAKEKDKAAAEKAYNPQKSFFDSLSSSSNTPLPAPNVRNGGGGGRRGGHGRNRREEEREKNVATFGEPGGVGLMGPGAYVPGWGGYGRRGGGGRGGRRGGAAPTTVPR